MKKLLSLFVLLVAIVTGANAADISITTKSGSNGTGTWSASSGSVTGTVALPNDLGNISFSLPKVADDNSIGSNYLSWKKNSILTITMPTGIKISAIEMTFSEQSKGPANSSKHDGVVADNISCSLGTVAAVEESTTVFSASGTASSSVTVTNTMGSEFRMAQIVITYSAGPTDPVFSVSQASIGTDETAKILVDGEDIYGANFDVPTSLWETHAGGPYISLSADGTITPLKETPEGYGFNFFANSKDAEKYNSVTSSTLSFAVTAPVVKYSINYDLGDATAGTAPTQASLAEDETFTVAAAPGDLVAPEGKAFKCWNDGSADYNVGDTYTVGTSDVTLTAQYQNIVGSEIIKAAMTSKNTANVTGTIGGTAAVNLQNDSYKFGANGNYVSLTLASGTFQAGDVINVHTATAADTNPGTLVVFGSSAEDIVYNTGTKGGLGDNKFVLPTAVNGKSTISVRRTSDYNFNGYVDYISVTRSNTSITLNASGYATYSKGTDFEFAGAKAYKMALNESAGTIAGTEVTGAIAAGEGILFKGEAGATVAITETTGATALEGNSLIGSTDANGNLVAKPTYCYALSGDTFKNFTGAALTANKAFFSASSNLSNSFEIVFEGEGEATAVEAVAEANAEASAPIKVIKNGKLYIGNFNVAGQQVK